MAYAALISLVQTLDLIPQPDQQITSLREKACHLQAILENSSQTINDLEGRIRDAAYEAEDIVEKEILISKSLSSGVMICSCFREMIYAIQNLFVERSTKYVEGLQKIIHEFDSIMEVVSNIKKGEVEYLQPNSSSRIVITSNKTLVGVDEKLMQIKDQLTGSSSKLETISIHGMGGIGKTTLARNLYEDSLIEYHFDIRAWIVVSQQYHDRDMLTSLLDSIGYVIEDKEKKSNAQLAEYVYKSLKGLRYLIVMDDVWDTKVCDDVKRFLPDDNNDSRIILTTRHSDVANYANSTSPNYHMNLLSSEDSWDLLRQKVFGEECCPFELEEIGRKIAKRCKGLPLAIAVIGGLLSKFKTTLEYCKHIAKNVKSAVTGNDDDGFTGILSLSYNALPHHLKACFLYMGVFPEDYEIYVSRLVNLWIAEGFVKEPDASKTLEELARDYLKDLVDRSLVQVHKTNQRGETKTCSVHDLLNCA